MEQLKALLASWNQKPLVNRLWVVLTVSVVIVVEGREYLKAHSLSSSARVLSVRRNLVAGSIVSIHDLNITQVNADSKHEYFDEQDLHEVIGSALSVDLKANEPISKKMVREVNSKRFSIKVPKGLRAYSIQLISNLPIEPRDHVDIIGRKNNTASTEILLEDKKVLGVKSNEVGQNIVIAVSTDEAAILDGFKEVGGFSIALRNPEDTSLSKKKENKKTRTRVHPTVEVLD